MSPTALLLLIAVTWSAIGMAVSIWMRRRGHRLFTWAYLGAVLGPLVLPLALEAIVSEEAVGTTASHPSWSGGEKVAVLVAVDGSSESLAAARAAVDLLGDRIGRLSLATVIDYDSGDYTASKGRRDADARLDSAARAIGFESPERAILVGSPADALRRAADSGGFDLLVVGHRGRGASRALLGSVASHLAGGDSGVSVLIR